MESFEGDLSMSRGERMGFRTHDGTRGVSIALDTEQYSAAVVLALATNPANSGPGQMVVVPVPALGVRAKPLVQVAAGGKRATLHYNLQLVCVDNEDVFVEATHMGRPCVKSVLYCLRMLSSPVSVSIRAIVSAWDIRALLYAWLLQLIRYELAFESVLLAVTLSEEAWELHHRLEIGCSFLDGTTHVLFHKLTRTTRALSLSRLAHREILFQVERDLSRFYLLAQADPSLLTPEERLASIEAELYHKERVVEATVVGGEVGSSSRRTPSQLLEDLSRLEQGEAALQALLEDGDLRPFQALELPHFKEAALKRLHMDKLSVSLQSAIIQGIAGTSFSELSLSRTSALTDADLKTILVSCPGLVELNVAHCTQLQSLGSLASHCRMLQVLDASYTNVTPQTLDAVESVAVRLSFCAVEGVPALTTSPRRYLVHTPRTVYGRLPLRLQFGLWLLYEAVAEYDGEADGDGAAAASSSWASARSMPGVPPVIGSGSEVGKGRKKVDKRVVRGLKSRFKHMAMPSKVRTRGRTASLTSAVSFRFFMRKNGGESDPGQSAEEEEEARGGLPSMATAEVPTLFECWDAGAYVGLVSLCLRNCGLRVGQIGALCDLVEHDALASLHTIDVSWNDIGSIGATLLAGVWATRRNVMGSLGLKKLDMRFNVIDSHAFEALVAVRESEPGGSSRQLLFDPPYEERPPLLSTETYETGVVDWVRVAKKRGQKGTASTVLHDGTLVIGCVSGALYGWDPRDVGGELYLILNLHARVNALMADMGGNVVAATDAGVYLVHPTRCVVVETMPLPEFAEPQTLVEISPTCIGVGCGDGRFRFWDTLSPSRVGTMDVNTSTRIGATVMLSDALLVVGSDDGMIRVVELGGRVVVSIKSHPKAIVTGLCDMADGSVLSTGSDGRMVLTDLRTGGTRVVFEVARAPPSNHISTFCLLEDGQHVALAHSHSLHLVHCHSGLVGTWEGGHKRKITSLVSCRNGDLVSTGLDGVVSVWRAGGSVKE